MSAGGDLRRRRAALRFGLAALAACVIALVVNVDFGRTDVRADHVLVLPSFEARAGDANLVMVTTAEESYHIVRDPDGWVMTEKGRYPVRAEPLGQLSEGLSAMRFERAMTQDPKKHDRLGLGDPLKGGAGALLEVSDGAGEALAELIVGFKNGQVFVRRPGDAQAWATTGAELPPLQRGARWLDLDVVVLDPADISRVEIEPEGEGRAYALEPLAEDPGAFRLAPPDDVRPLRTSFAPTLPATALTRLRPIDVKPISDLANEQSVGVHRTHVYGGLVYEASVYANGGDYWVSLGVYAEEDDADLMAEIERLEEALAGWAFGVSRLEYDAFTTPFEAVALPE